MGSSRAIGKIIYRNGYAIFDFFSETFLWLLRVSKVVTTEINYKQFLGRKSTHLMTFFLIFLPKFHFKPIFCWHLKRLGKETERERKERINKLFIGLRSWPTSLLKNNAQLAKRNLFMKNGNEETDDSATHESVCGARGQIYQNTDRAKNPSDCRIR